MADVQLEFGAKIDKLLEAVEGAKTAVEGLKSHAESASESVKKLLEVAGIALSLEGLKAYIEHMAELGLETGRVMAQLGLSAEATVVLGGAARLTGTSVESLATSMNRMSLNIQQSTRDAFNPAALGLQVLGLRAKDLIGIPTDKYFEVVANAVSKFKSSQELANAVTVVGGRGMLAFLPTLMKGGEAWKHMEAEIKAAREGIAAAQPGMEQTHEKLTLMAMSAESFGARLFMVLKPAIDKAADAITHWLQAMDQGKISSLVLAVGTTMIEVGAEVALFFNQIRASWEDIEATLKAAQLSFKLLILPFTLIKAAAKEMSDVIIESVGGGLSKTKAGFETTERAAEKSRKAIVQWAADSKKSLEDFVAGLGKVGDETEKDDKKTAAAMDVTRRQRMEATLKEIDGEISAIKTGSEMQKLLIETEADAHRITQDKKFAQLQAELSREYVLEKAALQRKLAEIPATELALRAGVNAKLKELDTKLAKDQVQLNKEAIASMKRNWDELFGTLQGAFNAQLRGLLTGTTTWAAAMKNIFLDLTIKAIEFVEKWVLEWVAGQLATVTASTAADQAKIASKVAFAAEDAAVTRAAAMSNVLPKLGEVYAGLAAFFSFLGPGAPAAAAAETAVIGATAEGMAAAEVGAWNIPRAGVAMLHPGELVLPAGAAEAFRSMAGQGGQDSGGGGTNINVTISAWDGASTHSWLKHGGGARMIAEAIKPVLERNRTLRAAV